MRLLQENIFKHGNRVKGGKICHLEMCLYQKKCQLKMADARRGKNAEKIKMPFPPSGQLMAERKLYLVLLQGLCLSLQKLT